MSLGEHHAPVNIRRVPVVLGIQYIYVYRRRLTKRRLFMKFCICDISLGFWSCLNFHLHLGVSHFVQSAYFNSTQHKLQSTRPVLIALLDRAFGPLWGVGATAGLSDSQEHPCKILLSITEENSVDLHNVGRVP